MIERVNAESPVSGKHAATMILAKEFPQIVDFDSAGMTTEEVHYYLGESAGVAFFQFQALVAQARPGVPLTVSVN